MVMCDASHMRPSGASARKQHCCGPEHEELSLETSCSHFQLQAVAASKLQTVRCRSVMTACEAARQACAACTRASLGCAAMPAHEAVTERLAQLRSTPARCRRCARRARHRYPQTAGVDSRKKKHHSIALHCTAGYKHAMAPQPAHGEGPTNRVLAFSRHTKWPEAVLATPTQAFNQCNTR